MKEDPEKGPFLMEKIRRVRVLMNGKTKKRIRSETL